MARRVITALTAQNTKGVTGIHDVPADFIAAQIDAVFSDLDVGAVKIGMLSQRRRDRGGRGRARPLHGSSNVVLDPVMVATSGDRLLDAGRGRRAAPRADPARAGRDAEPARGGGAARRADRRRRGRDARAGASGCSRSAPRRC